MPRGQKSKLRARERRRQVRGGGEPENVNTAQATVEQEDHPSSSSADTQGVPHSSSADEASSSQLELGGAESLMAAAISVVANPRSNEDASNQIEEKPGTSQAATEPHVEDLIDQKIAMLVHYLLYKYQMKEPITKADMLKNIVQSCKNHFPEILKKASEHVELIFGLDVKELDPIKNIYVLVNKLEMGPDAKCSDSRGVPKTGLLMTVLSVIFTKGNCATEEQVWEVLNMMGIQENRNHFIFGDPKKVITKDLVKDRYLKYERIPDSNPPRYQFMWGPRAHAETTKMKVLEFLSKIHNTSPNSFPELYEEAKKDEEERAQARVAARARTAAMATARSKAMPSSSYPKHQREPFCGLKGVISKSLRLSVPVEQVSVICSSKAIMPRGLKSKKRAREKRRRAQVEPELPTMTMTMAMMVAQASEIEGGNSRSSSSSYFWDNSENMGASGATSNPQEPVEAQPTITVVGAASNTGSTRGRINHRAERPRVSRAQHAPRPRRFPFHTVLVLVHFLLYKYRMKEPVSKGEMVRNVIQTHKVYFLEILKSASDQLELVFGLDVREMDPIRHIYILVNKLELSCDTNLNNDGVPKTGLLMTILGVIFMRGNRASEEHIWRFLNAMGLHRDLDHFAFGEPQSLIHDGFVKEKYLEYRQVDKSNPPCYEFRWGPRAHAETSKMKVLRFLANVFHTSPRAFPSWYKEALKDEEEKAWARAETKAASRALIKATVSARSQIISSCPHQV
ncbi:melanoma-associated antigen E1-like [Thomomys bottae]